MSTDAHDSIRKIEPTAVWNNFCDLNAVPRPSKKEERVIEFIKSFGESLNLPTRVDQAGNVIIQKPATAGKEQSPTVVIQSHLDMVHQKNADTEFDFDQQGIQMQIDGDWVKAKGTTLGADNGLGVAAIMSILASTDIAHPPTNLTELGHRRGRRSDHRLRGRPRHRSQWFLRLRKTAEFQSVFSNYRSRFDGRSFGDGNSLRSRQRQQNHEPPAAVGGRKQPSPNHLDRRRWFAKCDPERISRCDRCS